jgi:hypothetical protein
LERVAAVPEVVEQLLALAGLRRPHRTRAAPEPDVADVLLGELAPAVGGARHLSDQASLIAVGGELACVAGRVVEVAHAVDERLQVGALARQREAAHTRLLVEHRGLHPRGGVALVEHALGRRALRLRYRPDGERHHADCHGQDQPGAIDATHPPSASTVRGRDLNAT